jgi:hypothetical protein
VRVALADGLHQDGNEVVDVADGDKVKSYIDAALGHGFRFRQIRSRSRLELDLVCVCP